MRWEAYSLTKKRVRPGYFILRRWSFHTCHEQPPQRRHAPSQRIENEDKHGRRGAQAHATDTEARGEREHQEDLHQRGKDTVNQSPSPRLREHPPEARLQEHQPPHPSPEHLRIEVLLEQRRRNIHAAGGGDVHYPEEGRDKEVGDAAHCPRAERTGQRVNRDADGLKVDHDIFERRKRCYSKNNRPAALLRRCRSLLQKTAWCSPCVSFRIEG
mmetsp:Transcript_7226/g.13111  ORF Transcript_7226/g.13111 Transcript_7226/m.13111 type:complete len:214 (+) Transcript_7226:337-978(+)